MANKTWLHIGAGSFHRAHQAWYLHRLLLAGINEWTIALGNIRDDVTPMLEKLAAQDYRYVLETVDFKGNREYEEITSIRKTVKWDPELKELIAVGAASDTGVISFTVTESGYYLDTTFKLDQSLPEIQAELKGAMNTIYGTMAAILRRRMAEKGAPVTLLCCDNVRHNGERFRSGLLEFLELRKETELAAWVKANTTCPCCMVDRITPRPTPDIAERVKAKLGKDDKVPVMGESFIQWVVEENFIAGRPQLEKVGVEMVKDVQPYEEAKIRLLNATHSCVAWAGTLVGLSYIHEDTTTPSIRKMAYDYCTEDVIPCLTPSCPLDLEKYRDTVLDRFSNSYILDTNQRVAADGFSKIPAMIAPTLIECYAKGRTPAATAMLPALFFVFLEQWHQGKLAYQYQDGIMDAVAAHAMYEAADPLAVFAADEALFGPLAKKPEFAQLLRDSVDKVRAWMKTNPKPE